MISTQARDGFDYMAMQGIKSGLALPDDTCEITVIEDPAEIEETKIVVLTVASYTFRLMCLIHFTPDDTAKEFFARLNKIQASDFTEQSFMDAICESGNMTCGTLNRELARVYPHIGMSTPNIIDRNCIHYLTALGCGHVQYFRVEVNQTWKFHVTLCVSEYEDLDFSVDMNEVDNTGELEMF